MNIGLSMLLALPVIALLQSAAIAAEPVFTEKPEDYEDYGYAIVGAEWRFRSDNEHVIFVCWENPTTANQLPREWIKDQITKTWQANANLDFKGWEACAQESSGIRIVIKDEGPRVQQFGKNIAGVKQGMILNDTFSAWGSACQKTRESCIRSIAVHEFGHALGFAHEQNRPDTPGECAARHGQQQDKEKMLTSYDPESVMNYCNSKYNNDALLSEKDISSVQQLYGKK